MVQTLVRAIVTGFGLKLGGDLYNAIKDRVGTDDESDEDDKKDDRAREAAAGENVTADRDGDGVPDDDGDDAEDGDGEHDSPDAPPDEAHPSEG